MGQKTSLLPNCLEVDRAPSPSNNPPFLAAEQKQGDDEKRKTDLEKRAELENMIEEEILLVEEEGLTDSLVIEGLIAAAAFGLVAPQILFGN